MSDLKMSRNLSFSSQGVNLVGKRVVAPVLASKYIYFFRVNGRLCLAPTNQFHGNVYITKVPYSKGRLAMWRFCLFWGGLI